MKTLSPVIAFRGSEALKRNCYDNLKEDAYNGDIVRPEDCESADTPWATPIAQRFIEAELEFGIPVWFGMLTEFLASRLPQGEAGLWATAVVKAIKPGVILDQAWPLFAQSLLRATNFGALYFVDERAYMAAIIRLICVHKMQKYYGWSLEEASILLREMASKDAGSGNTAALLAAACVAQATMHGSFESGSFYSQARAARAVLAASRYVVEAIFSRPQLQIQSEIEAYGIQARALLAILPQLTPYAG